MRNRKWVVVAVTWAASLVGVALWAQEVKPVPPLELKPGAQFGGIITGADIGFRRVAGQVENDGRIPGVWLIKVNGKWVETVPAIRMVRTGKE